MSNDLRARVSDQEDNFVERKSQGIKPAEIRATLCAFANSVPEGRTAILYIGVANDGSIIGCDNTDALQKRVMENADDCYPPISWSSEVLRLQDSDIVAVVVSASRSRPHFTGGAYVRVGSSTRKASKAQFDELVASRNSKTAAILNMRDQVISVVGVGHRIGSTRPMSDRHYHEQAECRVVTCDTHRVQLMQINNGATYSEGLDRIEVSYDHEKYRPKLIVRGSP